MNELMQLSEDIMRLQQAINTLRGIHASSVNEHKTGDVVGDRTATEGLFIGTVQQLKHYHRIARSKRAQLLAK